MWFPRAEEEYPGRIKVEGGPLSKPGVQTLLEKVYSAHRIAEKFAALLRLCRSAVS